MSSFYLDTGDSTAILQWKEVWLQAIALSWRNEAFRTLLINDPRAALAQFFQYDLPSTVVLFVLPPAPPTGGGEGSAPNAPQSPPHSHEAVAERLKQKIIADGKSLYGWQQEGDTGWSLPQPTLIMWLPPKPARPEDTAIALADYNASVFSFPFSTC